MKHKKSFFLLVLMISALGFACNSHQPGEDEHGGSTPLQLDNGKKWKADAPAITGFRNMQNEVIDFIKQEKENTPLAYYQQLGESLNLEINGILNQCKMTGQGHEELHKLLGQIIDEVKILKGTDMQADKAAVQHLKELVDSFDTYFE